MEKSNSLGMACEMTLPIILLKSLAFVNMRTRMCACLCVYKYMLAITTNVLAYVFLCECVHLRVETEGSVSAKTTQ